MTTQAHHSSVLVLARVALALLLAVPAVLAVAAWLGVVLMRVGGSPRRQQTI